MMKDNLEKFVAQNRAEFDRRRPPRMVWDQIEKQIDDQNNKGGRLFSLRSFLQIAAAIIFLVGSGVVIGVQYVQSGTQANLTSIENRFPEILEIERYYEKEVQQKVAQLAAFKDHQTEEVAADLETLDEILGELEVEIQDAPKGSEEQIINAMISNYQTKLEILERVLEKVQSTNQKNLNSQENEQSIEI